MPFWIHNSTDTVEPQRITNEFIGYYQSNTCDISLLEVYAKNIGNNAYYIKEDLASPMSDMELKTLIRSAIDNNVPIPEITFTVKPMTINKFLLQK